MSKRNGSARDFLRLKFARRRRKLFECAGCGVDVAPANWNEHVTRKCPMLKLRQRRYHLRHLVLSSS